MWDKNIDEKQMWHKVKIDVGEGYTLDFFQSTGKKKTRGVSIGHEKECKEYEEARASTQVMRCGDKQ